MRELLLVRWFVVNSIVPELFSFFIYFCNICLITLHNMVQVAESRVQAAYLRYFVLFSSDPGFFPDSISVFSQPRFLPSCISGSCLPSAAVSAFSQIRSLSFLSRGLCPFADPLPERERKGSRRARAWIPEEPAMCFPCATCSDACRP